MKKRLADVASKKALSEGERLAEYILEDLLLEAAIDLSEYVSFAHDSFSFESFIFVFTYFVMLGNFSMFVVVLLRTSQDGSIHVSGPRFWDLEPC